RSPRSTETGSVGARRGRWAPFLVQKPSLHRGKPGGGACSGAEALAPPRQARWGRGAAGGPLIWCRSLRSTGASPVGAPVLVQKPSLHRDKLGGGEARQVGPLSGAEAFAPPGQARWGRLFWCRS